MKKTAVLLMVITVLSKVFGFLRDITLSYFYGASSISDAYIISITITTVLFSLVITGISSGYIPLYKLIENDDGEKSARIFTNNVVNFVIIISTILIFFGLLFSDEIVKIFALGFDEDTLKIAVLFTRIGLVGIYFTSLTQLFSGYLQLNGKFAVPTIIGFPFNFIIILSIIISAKTNIIVLAIGGVIAALVQLLFLTPSLLKLKYRYVASIQLRDENVKKMAFLVLPIAMGMSVDHINSMVDKTLASKIVEGGISALTYATRLNDFVIGIFVISFITVLFPLISKMAANENTNELKKSLSEVLSSVMLLVVPASIGIMVLAEPIIKLLFGRGHFDEQAIYLTSQALFFYSIGMIGYGTREILIRAFYSLQDMKTPMINASIAVILNIILNIILSAYMGIGGLALATSIAALFSTCLLFLSLRKKIGPLGLSKLVVTMLKVILASGVMGAIVFLLNEYIWMDLDEVFKMGLVLFIGCSIYITIITMLKLEEAKIIKTFLRKKARL